MGSFCCCSLPGPTAFEAGLERAKRYTVLFGNGPRWQTVVQLREAVSFAVFECAGVEWLYDMLASHRPRLVAVLHFNQRDRQMLLDRQRL